MELNPNALLLLDMPQKNIDKIFSSFGVPSPNYSVQSPDYFPTKIAPTISEEEYEEAIREQARKDALSGAGYNTSKETSALRWEYESVAAPDRRKIVTSTIQTMAQNPLLKNSKIEFAGFKDSSGREVAKYSKNTGWMAIETQEEYARTMKFLSIYRETYQEALDGMSGGLNIRA